MICEGNQWTLVGKHLSNKSLTENPRLKDEFLATRKTKTIVRMKTASGQPRPQKYYKLLGNHVFNRFAMGIFF